MTNNPYQSPHEPCQTDEEPSAASRLGWHLLAPLASCLGTAVLVIAVMHVRSDRSKTRQPIVTYEGLFASWMPQLVYVGLGLSLLGILASGVILYFYQEESDGSPPKISASAAMALGLANGFFSLIGYGAIWED